MSMGHGLNDRLVRGVLPVDCGVSVCCVSERQTEACELVRGAGQERAPEADGGADGERAHRGGGGDRDERNVHAPARVSEEDEHTVHSDHHAQVHQEYFEHMHASEQY